jgi:Tol biopolymer transport system component
VNIAQTLLLSVDMRLSAGASRALGLAGAVVVAAFTSAPTLAGATLPGAEDGNVAFVAICDGQKIGQAIYSLNPNGGSPLTFSCPGGTAPSSTQASAGSIDSMPYFSADGTTLFLASNRLGNEAIFEVHYPSTIAGLPGSQADGATQLTFPATDGENFNDYAPTVSSNGTTLAFIRCNAEDGDCLLYTQSPVVGGTPTVVVTLVSLEPPDPVSGAADRPEIDPVDPTQVLYVGEDQHIHLVSLTGAFAERDLSTESGVGGSADEYPDWKPDGNRIIFDSNRTGGHKIYILDPTTTPATATALWGSSDPGTEIEPLYAPTSPTSTEYVWTKLGVGSNIVLDMGSSATNAVQVNLTANKTNNSQAIWQPIPLGAQAPEVPVVALLPAAGGVLLAGAVLLERRRKQRNASPPTSRAS